MVVKKTKKYSCARMALISAALCTVLLCLFATEALATGGEHSYEGKKLCIGGFSFGVKFGTAGVLVTDTPAVISGGQEVRPALDCGIKAKDIITKLNGTEVNTAKEISSLIENYGKELTVTLLRDGKEQNVTLKPAKEDVTGLYKAGLKLKDSMAGIGTVTYVDPESSEYGGLGHGICEPDTGVLMPLRSGSTVEVEIGGVLKGKSGKPGEIKGYLLSERTGNVKSNTVCGVFGYFSSLPELSEPIPIGTRSEIKEGKATIYSCLGNDGVKSYEIEISKIDRNGTDNKNFVVTVTDPTLKERTGGIVQGMSGSPIVQDGKLVGAITHVLVSDPSRGYGILIENMLNAAE